MRIAAFKTIAFCCAAATAMAGCSLLPPNRLEDPTKNFSAVKPTAEVIKSIRCEISSFLVANGINRAINARYIGELNNISDQTSPAAWRLISEIKKYPYFDTDNNQYGAIQFDGKNVNSATLSLGFDWKKISRAPKTDIYKSGNLVDDHIGPSLYGATTFEMVENIPFPQYADLGPADAAAASRYLTTAFVAPHPADAPFYCYKPLLSIFSPPKSILEVSADINIVADHTHPEVEQFGRMFVAGEDVTLARWLLNRAAEAAQNTTTIYPTTWSSPTGQLKYSFSLEIKPGLDIKYTTVSYLVNPLVPDVTGYADDTTTFTLWLNSTTSLFALGAQQGNACIEKTAKTGTCKKNP